MCRNAIHFISINWKLFQLTVIMVHNLKNKSAELLLYVDHTNNVWWTLLLHSRLFWCRFSTFASLSVYHHNHPKWALITCTINLRWWWTKCCFHYSAAALSWKHPSKTELLVLEEWEKEKAIKGKSKEQVSKRRGRLDPRRIFQFVAEAL